MAERFENDHFADLMLALNDSCYDAEQQTPGSAKAVYQKYGVALCDFWIDRFFPGFEEGLPKSIESFESYHRIFETMTQLERNELIDSLGRERSMLTAWMIKKQIIDWSEPGIDDLEALVGLDSVTTSREIATHEDVNNAVEDFLELHSVLKPYMQRVKDERNCDV